MVSPAPGGREAVGLRRNSIFNWFLREADFAKGVMKFRERATVSKFSRARDIPKSATFFLTRDISRHDQPD